LTEAANKSLVMLGAGGHARVLQEILAEQGATLSGYLAPTSEGAVVDAIWLGADENLSQFNPGEILLVNGLGSASSMGIRRKVYEAARAQGFSFRSVVDENAIIRSSSTLGAGAQIMPGAIIGSGVSIGNNVLINTGAIVDHDVSIGAHTHISVAAAIGGQASVGESTHVGLGARIIQGVTVGSHCTVGAGAVVIRDVPDGSVAVGVPATLRPINQQREDN
jgi:UDP-perosamine 4-acetyltransferase